MKLKGKKLEGANRQTLVIPRTDGRENIVLTAEAVLDYSDFDKLCPEPTPPIFVLPGGEKKADLEDATFKKRNAEYSQKRLAWMVIRSLRATPDLEWERVDLGDPNTWLRYEEELKDSGFSIVEIGRVRTCVFIANCLDDAKLVEARDSFLLSQRRELSDLSLLQAAPSVTPFGEDASV